MVMRWVLVSWPLLKEIYKSACKTHNDIITHKLEVALSNLHLHGDSFFGSILRSKEQYLFWKDKVSGCVDSKDKAGMVILLACCW